MSWWSQNPTSNKFLCPPPRETQNPNLRCYHLSSKFSPVSQLLNCIKSSSVRIKRCSSRRLRIRARLSFRAWAFCLLSLAHAAQQRTTARRLSPQALRKTFRYRTTQLLFVRWRSMVGTRTISLRTVLYFEDDVMDSLKKPSLTAWKHLLSSFTHLRLTVNKWHKIVRVDVIRREEESNPL